MITIRESEMEFGEYDDGSVFRIEKSEVYNNLSVHGVKTCEFILLRNNNLLFVEAKTSCPNYFAAGSAEEKKEKYHSYVNEIVQKMKDTLECYAGILLFRQGRNEIPETLTHGIDGSRNIILVLVVKVAEQRWLEPFSDVFKKELEKEMRVWRIRNFLVMNEELARKKGLVKEVAAN